MVKDVVVKGISLRVVQTDGIIGRPTIVFLHDSLGSIELWRNFPDELSKAANCNIIIYDRQGYGKSTPFGPEKRDNNYMEAEADVLVHLLKQCEVDNAILFGHSDGGTIALIAASKYPAGIKGVITEGAHIFVEDITLQGIRNAVEAFKTTNLRDRLYKYHGEKTDSVFWAWANTWLTDEYRFWSIEHLLPRITCPILIVQGNSDEYGTEAQVDTIVDNVSGSATKFMIADIGHTPHKEAKQDVLDAATPFILRLGN